MNILLLAILPVFAHAADPSVKCDIESLSDAQACIEKLALKFPEYEQPNDGLATSGAQALVKVMTALGSDEKEIEKAGKADFAGLVVQHGDEHMIYYVSMTKGSGVRAKVVATNYVVDLSFDETSPKEALDVDTYFLGIKEAHKIDVYFEIEEAIHSR